MDFAILANILLCFGALGVNIALTGGDEDGQTGTERNSAEETFDHHDEPVNVEQTIAADRDILAWFLKGGEDGPVAGTQADAANLGCDGESSQFGTASHPDPGPDDEDISNSDDRAHPMTEQASSDDPPDDADEVEAHSGGPASGLADATQTRTRISTEPVEGGEANGSDQVSVGQDAAEFTHVSDYDQDNDQIEIHYAPRYDASTGSEIPPVLQINDASDGHSALVVLDGTVIGQIDGAAGLDTSHFILVPDSPHDADPLPKNASHDDAFAKATGANHAGATAMETDSPFDTHHQSADDAWSDNGETEDGPPAGNSPEGDTIAEITGYSTETDVLELHFAPMFDSSGAEIPPVVTVETDAFRAVSTILLDGEPVAYLTGAVNLKASDIVLVRTNV